MPASAYRGRLPALGMVYDLHRALAAHLATSVTGCVDLPGYATVWVAMFGLPL